MSVFTRPRAYLGKPWIFLDFKSPSRIINHVELKLVQFIHSHHIDILLYELLVVKISCHIKHHTSPRTLRSIIDAYRRSLPVDITLTLIAIHFGREQLKECLDSIEYTGIVSIGQEKTA